MPTASDHQADNRKRLLRVAVIARTPRNRYSGGRYHALMLAQALAVRGHDTWYLTDNDPICADDITGPHELKTVICRSQPISAGAPSGDFDVVVITPHQTPGSSFWKDARSFARRRNARLALINFESPNWFNEVSPFERSESKWSNWRECTQDGCLVLSSAHESMRYAKEWFCTHPHRTSFDVWHPAINTPAAEKTIDVERTNHIVVIMRFDDPHKGSADLETILRPELAGYTIVVMTGSDDASPVLEELQKKAARFNIRISRKCRLTDSQKFAELRRAKLMVFPSYFEGFGYPPLEALYVGTPVVAYDLPVLRETCGDSCSFVPAGDAEMLSDRAVQLIQTEAWKTLDPSGVRKLMAFDRRAEAIESALMSYCDQPLEPSPIKRLPIGLIPRIRRLIRPRRIHVSSVQSMDGQLCIRGWVYSPEAIVSTTALFANDSIAHGIPSERPDVSRLFPELQHGSLGFCIQAAVTDDLLQSPAQLKCLLSNGDTLQKSIDISNVDEPNTPTTSSARLHLGISQFTYDPKDGMYVVRLWCFKEGRSINRLELNIGGREISIEANELRPDVVSKHAECNSGLCGFHLIASDLFIADQKIGPLTIRAFEDEQFEGSVTRSPKLTHTKHVPAKVQSFDRSGYVPGIQPLVAMVTHVVPQPETSGNRRVIAQCLRWLRHAGYDVLLVVQNHFRTVGPHIDELLELCDRLVVVDPISPLGTVPGASCNFDLCRDETKVLLSKIHAKTPLASVILQYVHMAKAAELLPNSVYSMVMTHDILHRLGDQSNQIAAWRQGTATQEAAMLNVPDTVIAITDHERAIIESILPNKDVITVGLSAQDTPLLPPSPSESRILLFAGSANPMNSDGLRWFLEDVWPHVRKMCPDVRLRIAGTVCNVIPKSHAHQPGVELLGVIDDLEPEVRQAAAILNCTRFGTGLKIKSIEAIAHGRALISTSNGVEGIATDQDHPPFLVAPSDEPHSMATIIDRMLNDTPYRREIEQRASAWAGLNLTEATTYEPMHSRLSQTVARKTPTKITSVKLSDSDVSRVWPFVCHLLEATCRVQLTGRVGVAIGRDHAFAACCIRWLTRHGLNVQGVFGPYKGKIEGLSPQGLHQVESIGIDRLIAATSDIAELGVMEQGVAGSGIHVVNFLGRPSAIHRSRMRAIKDSHTGETAFILGNGPSVRAEDLDLLAGRFVLAANRFHLAYDQTIMRPTWTACADMLMMEQHGHQILECCDTPLFLQSRGAKHLAVSNSDQVIEYDVIPRPKGPPPQVAFSDDCANGLGNGASIVFDLIQLAVWAGAKKLVLYGIDHSFNMPRTYNRDKPGTSVKDSQEDNHFIKGYRSTNEQWYSPVTSFIERGFEVALEHCEKRDIPLLNGTRGGGLEILPRVDFDIALQQTQSQPSDAKGLHIP